MSKHVIKITIIFISFFLVNINTKEDIQAATIEYPIVESVSKQETELKENSFRYENGKLREESSYFKKNIYPNAWNKVDGYYRNSRGEIIEGAIKKGIDVSEHNGTINWELVKNDGIDFAIIRCGYGMDLLNQDDKQWEHNVHECERLNIPYGVYLYSYATNIQKAKSEAQHVLRLLKNHSVTYPIYYDLEDLKTTFPLSSREKGEIAKTFCDILSAEGYDVGIYSNLDWWTNYLTDANFQNNKWSKWVAQYNYKCDYKQPYDIWQCTSKGQVEGIKTNVDINFLMNKNAWPQINSISFPNKEKQLLVGQEERFKVEITPANATSTEIKYRVGNNSIAKVDNTGKVTALKEGNTYLHATASNGVTTKCLLRVKNPVDVKNLAFPYKEKQLVIGQTEQFKVEITPANATNTQIKYHVGNNSIAKVDNTGKVTALKEGNTYLHVTASNGVTTKCLLRVKNPVDVKNLAFPYKEKQLVIGQTEQFKVEITPANATNTQIKYHVGNNSIAKVDNTGKVTALKEGNTYLHATASNGVTTKCLLRVKNPVDVKNLAFPYKEKQLVTGQTEQFKVEITPANATNTQIKYHVGNNSIAKVDNTGKVTALKEGNTYLHATASNGITAKILLRIK